MKHLSEEAVRQRLGDRADEKIEAARRVLDAYGDERTKSRLSRTLLGNSAEIIEKLAEVAEREPFFREQHGVDGHQFKGMDSAIHNQFKFHMADMVQRAAYEGEMEVIRNFGPVGIEDITINSDNGDKEE